MQMFLCLSVSVCSSVCLFVDLSAMLVPSHGPSFVHPSVTHPLFKHLLLLPLSGEKQRISLEAALFATLLRSGLNTE